MALIEKLGQYRIAKNMSVLAATQLLSRAATIIYVAALARYVGSEGIGKISTATSLNGILLLIVGPGLSILFVRDVAPDTKRAASYVTNTLFLRLILFIPFFLISAIFAHSGRYPEDTANIIHLYTLVFILESLSEILICVFRSHERMEYEGVLQIARDVANISLSLVAIALGWSLYAIVAMSIVASLVRLVLALRLVSTRFTRPELKVNFSLSKSLLLASLPFGLLMVIQTLQAELGTFVLSLYYNADVVGVYAAANTLIVMLLMLPNSFASAIFPNLSRLHQQSPRDLRLFYRLSFKYLLILGFPLGLGTILVGQRAVLLIYGDSFNGSPLVIQIMAFFLFMIVGYSNGPILHATGRQRFYAWTQGTAAVGNFILCFLLVPTLGPIGAALSFTTSGIFTFFVHSLSCHRQLHLRLPWRSVIGVGFATALMGVVVVVGIQLGVSWILMSAVVAPVVYGALLFLLHIVRGDELRTLAGASPNSNSTNSATPLAIEPTA
ncbi:MAG: flippase [Chloroflexota bacterium]